MFVKILIRVILAIIFAYLGNRISKQNIADSAPQIFNYIPAIATVVSAIIGLLFPDLLRVITKIGIRRLAEDITARITSQIASFPTLPISYESGQIPFIKFRKKSKMAKNKYTNPMIIDTSALIDGRISAVADAGFLFGTIIVIPAVLTELRHIADLADDLKRQRGRLGLDVLENLKKNKNLKIVITSDQTKQKEVDQKIIDAAKKYKAKIITCDYNLNKAAGIMRIISLNVNDLANKVKTSILPGEMLNIKIVQSGKEPNQGVGYLDDGTMIVVEDGKTHFGKEVKVEIKRILQTSAGKMIFSSLKK